jgi:polyribonucleotide nucleotidyltransferase
MIIIKEKEIAGKTLTIETGRLAKQANGSVLVKYEDTMILATATYSSEVREGIDFFPLSVEYRERSYAAGRIPGGFFKREGRPSEKEILSARLIDRPLRPLFPKNFKNETQIVVFVLSHDQENDADVIGTIGASAALSISNIPFGGPVASVRVGKIGGDFVLNPTFSQLEESAMELVISGTYDSILMVEGESMEISEKEMLDAIKFGHEYIKEIIELQQELIKEIQAEKLAVEKPEIPAGIEERMNLSIHSKMQSALRIQEKKSRNEAFSTIKKELPEELGEEYEEYSSVIMEIFENIEKEEVRKMIINENLRLDGRGLDDIRAITCEIGVLPRAHGSALFTRGQTQSLGVITLGTKVDEQFIETLEGESKKSYMLHYNFPPFSVGEARPFRGTNRREVGHGNLAERALKNILPDDESFPYTIRIVSDILESNGSSSMASVCSGSLSLMDAGVPTKCHIAGIAMGLIKEDQEVRILTDILGDEDHLGDMDFKVAGSREGITAFQMDIKIAGITFEIMETALERAKIARHKILDVMESTIEKPNSEISQYAPRILTVMVPVEKIGLVIGPGGKTIRGIIEKTGAKIDIDDDGLAIISSVEMEAATKAKKIIESLIEEPEAGRQYEALIKKITNYGAFAEFMPGKEGLIHISELDTTRVGSVEDIVKVGDKVMVILKKVDKEGRFDLSRKEYLRRNANKDS